MGIGLGWLGVVVVVAFLLGGRGVGCLLVLGVGCWLLGD